MNIVEKIRELIRKHTPYVLVRHADLQTLIASYESVKDVDAVGFAVLKARVAGLEEQLEIAKTQRAVLEKSFEEERALTDRLFSEFTAEEHRGGGMHIERNHLVVLVAHMANLLGWDAGVGTHEGDAIEGFAEVVRIDTPVGQLSWHIHDTQRAWLEQLPPYEKPWDGTHSEKKYALIRSLFGRV